MKTGIIVVVYFSVSCMGSYAQHHHTHLEMPLSVAWESKYVLEGREVLDEGGLFSGTVGASRGAWALECWYAAGDSMHYQELNTHIFYGFELLAIEWEARYTYLYFDEAEDMNDHELGLAGSYRLPLNLVLEAEGYFSDAANGSFVTAGLAYEEQWFQETLSFRLYAYSGYDFGYASPSGDQLNHSQAGLEVSYSLNRHLSLDAYAAHSWAEKDVKADGGGDVSWVGLGISGAF